MNISLQVYLVLASVFLVVQYELIRLQMFNRKEDDTLQMVPMDAARSVNIDASYCKANQRAGPIKVVTENNTKMENGTQCFNHVTVGGKWRPRDCVARSRVAVLVPYRARHRELAVFLHHMHPFLQRQQLDYTVFVVEQTETHPFNKGAISNVAFHEAVSRGSYDCFIINDVDVLPEDDRIGYECADHPRHLAVLISKYNYSRKLMTNFGGAIALTRHQYQTVNGFSNAYWAWGKEDDDLGARVRYHGYKLIRYPHSIARFKTLDHEGATRNTRRFYYYENRERRYKKDGLNSLMYSLVSFQERHLYTHIMVDLDRTAIKKHVDSLMPTKTKLKPTRSSKTS